MTPSTSTPASARDRSRPLWISAFDAAAIAAFAIVWVWLAGQLWQAPRESGALPLGLAALLLGYLLADGLAGFVHWFADSYFEEDAPVLGPLLIEPFREHHRDPKGITHHGFLEVCGNNCAACLLPLAGTGLALSSGPLGSAGTFVLTGILSVSFFLFATNGFHRWAHVSDPPAWVAWLQRHRLILSPEHHALHHRGDHDRAFCVTSGWLNPLLDRAGVFHYVANLGRTKRHH